MEGLFIAAVFIGIPWVLGSVYRSHLSHQRFMKVLQLKAEMNARLLDRVGSDPAVLEFLKSDAQNQMFDVRVSEPIPRLLTPYSRVLTAIQLSFMLLSAGVAFLSMRPYMDGDGKEVFLVFGTMGVALGVGSLLSAAAAVFAAKVWRTLEESRA